jgi:hypothetical protein
MAASGTDKKATVNQLFGSPPSGSILYWNGSSTGTPSGAADVSVGSSGQLHLTGISDPGSPAAGDVWFDTTQTALSFLSAGNTVRSGGIMWQGLSSGTAVVNSTSLTSVLAGISTTKGTLTFPANGLTAGKIIRPVIWCLLNSDGTPTLRVVLKLGSTIIFDFTTGVAVAAGSNGSYCLLPTSTFQVQTTGSSGTVIGAVFSYANASGGAQGIIAGSNSAAGSYFGVPTACTINTTGSLLFDMQVQFSTAAAANKCQFVFGYLEVLG